MSGSTSSCDQCNGLLYPVIELGWTLAGCSKRAPDWVPLWVAEQHQTYEASAELRPGVPAAAAVPAAAPAGQPRRGWWRRLQAYQTELSNELRGPSAVQFLGEGCILEAELLFMGCEPKIGAARKPPSSKRFWGSASALDSDEQKQDCVFECLFQPAATYCGARLAKT